MKKSSVIVYSILSLLFIAIAIIGCQASINSEAKYDLIIDASDLAPDNSSDLHAYFLATGYGTEVTIEKETSNIAGKKTTRYKKLWLSEEQYDRIKDAYYQMAGYEDSEEMVADGEEHIVSLIEGLFSGDRRGIENAIAGYEGYVTRLSSEQEN